MTAMPPGADEVDWDQLRESHAVEAQERLATMEQALLDLEAGDDPETTVDLLQRQVHTLKGNAGLFDFVALGELAHAFEDALAELKRRARSGVGGGARGEGAIKSMIPTLFRGLDGLRDVLGASFSGDRLSEAHGVLAHALRALGSARLRAHEETEDGVLATATTSSSAALAGGTAGVVASALGAERSSTAARASLRVDLRRIDRLVDLASEISVARGRVASAMSAEAVSEGLRDVVDDSLSLLDDLSDLALTMRLVALGPTLQAQRRTVRDTAAALGKDAALTVLGDDVEIDLSLVDLLQEALGHIVRNAVAHGIETPGVRATRGKPRTGQIRIRAFHETSQVLVEVEDDGGGLDERAIRARASAMGATTGAGLGETLDVTRLVFLPGLSTAEALTGVSGRGVGLDAVRAAIEKVGGSIEVTSRPGEGALFRLRLPLTLVVMSGLSVTVAGESVIVPLNLVSDCAVLPPALHDGGSSGDSETHPAAFMVRHGGQTLPVMRLSRALFETRPEPNESLVVVEQSGLRVGLAVDSLGGNLRVVVRAMSPLLRSSTSILGAAILGDGRVALILDVPDLIRRAIAATRHLESSRPS